MTREAKGGGVGDTGTRREMSSNLGKEPLAKKYRTKTTTTGLFFAEYKHTHIDISTLLTHITNSNRVSVRKKIIINVLSEGVVEDQFSERTISGLNHLLLRSDFKLVNR